MADRVFHQGLDRQRRNPELRVFYPVFHADVGKAQYLDIRVEPGVLQLLGDGDQVGLAQCLQVLPQIGAEILQRPVRQGGILGVERADGVQCVEQKVGLDLGHHNLNALRRHQVALVLAHKLDVEPDVVEHAAHDNGNGQKGDGLRLHHHVQIHDNGQNDDEHHGNGNQALPPPGFAIEDDGSRQQFNEQHRADKNAGIPQRAM